MDKGPNNKKRFSLQGIRDALQGLGLSSFVLIAATAVALVAVGSFAWVSRNRNLDSYDMQMNMDDNLFELVVAPVETVNPAVVTDLGLEATDLLENQTGKEKQNLVIALETDPSLYEDGEATPLRPGHFGKITFYFKPTVNESMTAKFQLQLNGHFVTPVPDAETQAAVRDLLKGHILFFSQRIPESGSGPFRYADQIEPDTTFDFDTTNAELTENGYKVELYWAWPQTVGKLLLKDGEAGLNGPALLNNDPQIDAIISCMKEHPVWFFSNGTEVGENEGRAALIGRISELSDGYNHGDQLIGDRVNAITVTVTASAEINS